ncbi:hypothetical protein HGG76_28100 [Ochrobactrum tritici]|uniref:Uncharacterized protein n=1 Tax=Brucella tritici TaxID=94626 RepID=A0A7X6FT11_9HYPH|nr:hypothetical protein [Brucella tritici]
MTRVYGGCVEPGGFDLDNDLEVVACPDCAGEAFERYWETCEGGSINQNHTIICTECDYAEGIFRTAISRAAKTISIPKLTRCSMR